MKDWAKNFIQKETLNAFSATFFESEQTKYLFLDFDDTVRESVNYGDDNGPPVETSQVKIFPGVGAAIRKWKDNGWLPIGTTNQKGALRRREFLPPELRQSATLEQAAEGCAKVVQETLNQLGFNFPVLFASDATVFLYDGSLKKVGVFGTESKAGGKAAKPSTAMGDVAYKLWGSPDLSNSLMIGDSYENGDENFAKGLGIKWFHPGPLGRDFIEYTNEKFGEELEETGGYIADVPFYGTHGY
jgi:histidinol phosphatase-like enzyme